jgi:hypothetical protein
MYHEEAWLILPAARVSGYLTDRGRAYVLPPPDCYLLNEELAAVLASNGS